MRKRTHHTAHAAVIALFLTSSSAFSGSGCPSTRPAKARFRTLAWVSTMCGADASGLVAHQEIDVQRGDSAPVVVSRVDIGPVPDPAGLCRVFGTERDGNVSIRAGFYASIAVSPDGRRVAFELNDAFSAFEHDPLSEEQRGLYVIDAGGGQAVKVAAATGLAPYRALGRGETQFDFSPQQLVFSPDGRYLVYQDLGPASDGQIDAQLWSLRLADRTRTQLSSLSRRDPESAPLLYVFAFADTAAVGFYTLEYNAGSGMPETEFYSVSVNGEHFRTLTPITLPDGQVIPQFALTGRRPAAQGIFLDGVAENPMSGFERPREIFLASGRRVLQLTNFHRVDLNLGTVVSRTSNRVFFSASADPFGCNPTNNCQVFSVDTFGGHLRQLTRFDTGNPEHGCFRPTAPDCRARVIAEDRATGSILLDSSCDPFGTSPTTNQVYVMRPDGSGLRQITQARGVVTDTPDVVEVESPGPIAYQ